MEAKQKHECPIFPYFGANYPDAQCYDGYLWDLDKVEDGRLYGGGDEPCTFCNSELFIESNLDEDNTEESLKEYVAKLKEMYL